MKNKRIYSFFKSDKRGAVYEDKNMTNSISSFLKDQRIIEKKFHINYLERDP